MRDTITKVLDVKILDHDKDAISYFALDAPKPGTEYDVYNVTIAGWAVGKFQPVKFIDLFFENTRLRSGPVNISRPDVSSWLSLKSDILGFRTQIGVIGLPSDFTLSIRAGLKDDTIIPLASIRGQHKPLVTTFHPSIQPLIVTSLGRTGTTVTVKMLSAHPKATRHAKYHHESRPAMYWLHVLKVLSEPSNHFQSTNPDGFAGNLFWAGHHPNYVPPVEENLAVDEWFGRTYPELLADFCMKRIEDFFVKVSADNGQKEPAFFIEKITPAYSADLFWELYPRGREIILVRDFRDVLSSILSFNKKRGFMAFGREQAQNDEDYVKGIFSSAVHSLLRAWKRRYNRAYLLRYEDMIFNPNETLKSILDYIGLEAPPSVLENMLKAVIEPMSGHMSSPDIQHSVSRWLRDLDAPLRDACRESLGEALAEFGYALD